VKYLFSNVYEHHQFVFCSVPFLINVKFFLDDILLCSLTSTLDHHLRLTRESHFACPQLSTYRMNQMQSLLLLINATEVCYFFASQYKSCSGFPVFCQKEMADSY